MTKEMSGLVTLVTGASSGIGEATAVRLAGKGFRVALVARRREKLDKIAAEINANGGTTHVVEADISLEHEARRAVQETIDAFGRLDVLVNNAGVMLLGPATKAPLEEWQQMIAVNLNGLLYVTHAALPHLVEAAQTAERKVADIVNISSIAGRRTHAGSAVYCLTKYGVVGLSGTMREELKKQHVRVSLVEPGVVDTELYEHSRAGVKEYMKDAISKKERLDPQDIAEAIEYIVTRPRHVIIDEIMITPTDGPF
jgi:NADP-dependent 3-hydroxy acid dehydrogenase YdfG